MPSRKTIYTAGGVISALVIIFIIFISVGRKSTVSEVFEVSVPKTWYKLFGGLTPLEQIEDWRETRNRSRRN